MRKINCVSMPDVSFCFLESIGERVGPGNEVIRILPCYFFLERSQDTRDTRSGHLESFVQSEEAPHVFDFGDVFWFHVNEGVLPVRGHFQGTSFLPDPTCNVCRVREDYDFVRFYPEVG